MLRQRILASILIVSMLQCCFSLHMGSRGSHNLPESSHTVLTPSGNINYLNNVPETSPDNIQKLLDKIEQGIVNNGTSVAVTPTSQLKPLNFTAKSCLNVTSEQYGNIMNQSTVNKKSLQNVIQTIKTLPPTTTTWTQRVDAENQIVYIDDIQKELKSGCNGAEVVTKTVYQSNIYANNWILGNKTADSLIRQYVKRSIIEPNVTNCPLERPYFNQTECIKCNGSTPLFNLQTSVCVACPAGTAYSQTQRNCVNSKGNFSNPVGASRVISAVPGQPPKAASSSDVVCLDQTPFYNGTACIDCLPPNNLFNETSKQCTSCGTGPEYDPATYQCKVLVLPPNGTSLKYLGRVITTDPNSTLPTNSTIQCPDATPFFDGSTCINCSAPTPYFNLDTKTCVSCPNGTALNSTSYKCQALPPNSTNQAAINRTLTTNPALALPSNTSVPCPAATPFWNGTACINCTDPTPYFNLDTKLCANCPTGTAIDSSSFECVALGANGTAPSALNRVLTNNPASTLPDNYSIPCPSNQPFWNGSVCVNCSAPTPYFNLDTKTCVSCPNGTALNSTSYQCQALSPNGTASSALNKTLTSNPSLAQPSNTTIPCPDATPFWNGTACINCTDPTPIFNLDNNSCTSCPTGQVLNATTHQCQTVSTPAPTPNGTAPSALNKTITSNPSLAQPSNTTVPCPDATPFFNGTGCVNCTDPTPIFNLDNNSCTSCPNGTTLNSTTHKCQAFSPNGTAKSGLTRAITQDPASTLPTNTSIPCPDATPFWNGAQCINCTDPTPNFNLDTKACASCPNGTTLNSTTYQCQTNPAPVLTPNGTATSALNKTLTSNPSLAQPSNTTIPCPDATPFWNGTACINCTDPTPIFNLDNNSCTSCPTGQVLNATTHQCQTVSTPAPTPNGTAPSALNKTITSNPSLAQPSNTTVPCPDATPFFNGTGCVNCTDPTPNFNLDTNVCSACPTGQVLNTTTHQCQIPSAPVLTPNGTAQSGLNRSITQSPASTLPSNTTVPCPDATPFWNGTGCINCTDPTPNFNLDTKECTSCPNGTTLNSTTYQCQAIPPPVLTPNGTAPSALNKTITSDPSLAQPSNTTVPCPDTTPFWNGTGCINCTDPTPYFNLDTKLCSSCPQGQVLNTTTHQCQSIVPPAQNPNATNPASFNNLITPTATTPVAANASDVPCPSSTPFWNGQSCIACPTSTPYFVTSNSSCVACNSPATYNATTHQCVTPPAVNLGNNNSVTSNSAPNLVNDGYVTPYWQQVHDNLTQAGAQDCPSATPYYNGFNCITCSSPTPYFNLATRQCMNCDSGFTYDESFRECLDSTGTPQQPNLMKMSGTVFSHHKLFSAQDEQE